MKAKGDKFSFSKGWKIYLLSLNICLAIFDCVILCNAALCSHHLYLVL
jgi:hypothetical protein